MIKSSMGASAPFILSLAFAAIAAFGIHMVPNENSDQAGSMSLAANAITPEKPTPLVMSDGAAKQKKLVARIVTRYKIKHDLAEEIVGMAHEEADKQGVDPVLLLALVGVESSFNPKAVSHANARGLTQVIARWHPEKVRPLLAQGRSIMEPKANLSLGAQILAEYHRKFKGDRVLALQQYNGSLKDRSRKYSRKVISMYEFLSRDPSSI